MKKTIITTLGALALLGSTAGMAMTVSITPTPTGTCCSATYAPGTNFVLTIDVSGMSGNGSTTGSTGGSFTLTFDGTKVAFTSLVLPAAATVPATAMPAANTTSNPFDFVSPISPIDANTVAFSVLRNGASPFNYASGSFTAFKLTGTVLMSATGGSANIVLVDDEMDNSWTDQDANPYTGVIYNQADITVSGVPVPAAIWMLVSALGGLAGIKRFRRV